ncbi:polyferredoxin [Clostridium tetanomorphum]|uniref:4Fe-4S binding protein n=1 Tax=Clostridium tetanomorphum TaxID=1553 RepID=A0A923ECG7_CLOTT|nr:4Fe-4S binding protein [Clostridium tetanomorphum]KAJ51276.1 hypothetical protein CTM_13808 [Clostridium tetanomorphum DSM 665]MBC2397863.1 4Fe-4S binding protein [Clostridium tetanomorphum]MBP1864822.1 polyferredoxin [Clostridium tetanomorphum]NRS83998.1 polyferredoxin [Clostridium tetanomorphum]NRZ97216.1 polyferredoxin [Clostridium tetanomorphum]
MTKNNKKVRDYLWIASLIYLFLGLFNIVFAWLGMICFLVPLFISIFGGGKAYCNNYCGRGQLLDIMGKKLKLSRNKRIPNFLRTKAFRYGFLMFFLVMFSIMIFNTYLVFAGNKELGEVITLLWIWKLPWNWVNTSFVPSWIAQFAFGFYSLMLTSNILGVITMILYKPRSWCVYCPMGTMTQGICSLKNSIE